MSDKSTTLEELDSSDPRYTQALDVECKACGAEKGEPCRDAASRTHLKRRAALAWATAVETPACDYCGRVMLAGVCCKYAGEIGRLTIELEAAKTQAVSSAQRYMKLRENHEQLKRKMKKLKAKRG